MLMRLIALLAGLVFSILSMAEEKTIEIPVKKDEVEEAKFKNDMEARISRDLEAYLGHNRFIIEIDAKIKKTRTVVKEQPDNGGSPPVPPKPRFSAISNQVIMESPLDDQTNEELPGLPVGDNPFAQQTQEELENLRRHIQQLSADRKKALDYAESLRKAANQKINKVKQKTLGFRNSIKKLSITIVLDKSLNDEQIAFIRSLISRKVGLDELRGDTLNIVRTEFKEIDKQPEVIDFWEKYQAWLMLAAFTLMILVLLLALYIFNRKLSAELKESRRREDNFENFSVPAAAEIAPVGAKDESDVESDKKRQLIETRQELVTLGLGQPQLFQQVVNESINNGQHQMVSALYNSMGKNLFRSLCPKISAHQMIEVEEQIENQELDLDQQYAHLSDLHQKMLRKLGDGEDGSAPFAFLDKLNDSQVLYLIKDEETKIKALVFSQLPAERAAQLIQRLPDKIKATVAFELGEFESLPVSAFKDVADRLAKNSMNIPSFENISTDGLSVLTAMLDKLSSAEETRMLKTLRAEQPETFYRLRKVYYTFADLFKTPDRVIANELRDVDRSTLAKALCHTPVEFKRHVVSALPDKLRAAVINELKTVENSVAQEEVESSRQSVVYKMREVLKAGRFSMDELTSASSE